RWWTRREPGWQRGLVINGLGAATTAVVALVVGVSNFTSGAWVVIVLVPLMMAMLTGIRRHYRSFDEALRTDLAAATTVSTAEPIVIVPIARLDRPALGALTFARKLSDRATAIHVTNDAADAGALREQWTALGNGMELVVVESPYRALMGPLLRYMDALQSQDPSRPVVVVLSEIVPRHWWENFLHNQSSLRLKLRLFGRRNTIVVDVPYHLD
ncbi:MAG TPA: amino acid permease, partial [Candidatus Limnocylindria bacterium]|nr:amino acid permease [Candidatus Limnocylindria bacterium]